MRKRKGVLYLFFSLEFFSNQLYSLEISAFSNATTNFMKYEQAYIFPHAITALAPTTTKFGITTKDLIGSFPCLNPLRKVVFYENFFVVATQNRRIQSFPRRLLDPRRPHRKPTTEELEEFLIEYDSILPNDPRRVLSHNYDVSPSVLFLEQLSKQKFIIRSLMFDELLLHQPFWSQRL